MTSTRPIAEVIAAGDLEPYVGAGADGARRSAGIARDELATLPTGPHQPGWTVSTPGRRADLEAIADAWDARATALEDLER